MNNILKKPFFCSLFIISTFLLNAAPDGNDSINKTVSALETAIKSNDMEKLKECIAPDFSVSVANIPEALNYVTYLRQQISEPDSIRIVSGTIECLGEDGISVTVTIYLKGEEPIETNLRLNENYKIKYIDYFDQFYGIFRDKPSKLRAVVPFEFENDAIILTLKLNDSDRPLRFIFDTGADGMAIPKNLADSLGLIISHEQNTSVVGETRNVSISSGNTVHLDTLSLPNQSIAIFDEMRHEGLIGLNLAKSFIVKINFDQSLLFLYDLGDYTHSENETVVPIIVPRSIAVIPCELDLTGKGAITGNFVLDTGATGFHVVAFSPFVRRNRLLLSGFKYESKSGMMSFGHVTPIYQGNATTFSFGGIHCKNLPIALQASTGNTWTPNEAGSIGIKLISKYNITINLVKKELYMEKRKE